MIARKTAVLYTLAISIVSGCSNYTAPGEATVSQSQALSAVGGSTQRGPDAMAPPIATGGPLRSLPARPVVVAQVSTAQLALGDASELATLQGIALKSAALAGVSSPSAAKVVAASDHQTAEYILSGDIVNDHAPVYVIVESGGPFTSPRTPRGQPAPQGNFLTVTVDATTHRVTDVGYVNSEPDLTTIGSFRADLFALGDAGGQ